LSDLAVANTNSNNLSVLINDGVWSPPSDATGGGGLAPQTVTGTDMGTDARQLASVLQQVSTADTVFVDLSGSESTQWADSTKLVGVV
jgi:hypothetical protein